MADCRSLVQIARDLPVVRPAAASVAREETLHPPRVAAGVEGSRSAGIPVEIRLAVVHPDYMHLEDHLGNHPAARLYSSGTKQ